MHPHFKATSNIPNVGEIRQEVYQFTILNPNEYKYSYIFNKYANYYVEKVEKDGIDITDSLVKTLDVSTITKNNKTYLAEIPLSYLDEKTGAGTYLITINSNDRMLQANSSTIKFTFKVTIKVGTAPIKVSVEEGTDTTDEVTVSFNTENIYKEMGECTLRILQYSKEGAYERVYYSLAINENTQMSQSPVIERGTSGIFYVQLVSPSENLLYSYKIIKSEPMNASTIIIIVVAVVVVIVAIIIIIKLRKKISVK